MYHDPFYPIREALNDLVETILGFFSVFIPAVLILIVLILLLRTSIRLRKSGLSVGLEGGTPGIVFGRFTKRGKTWPPLRVYSPIWEEGHVGIFGGTGDGKTSSQLIPSMRSLASGMIRTMYRNAENDCAGSFCIDISGDISSNVDLPNKIIFDPFDLRGTPYNVFGLIDALGTDDEKNDALSKLAYLIIPEKKSGNAAADYFANGSRNILIASLIAFYHKGWDFIEICRHIVGTSQPDLFSEIDRTGNHHAIMYINGFVRADGSIDNNVAGCKESCNSAILLFATNASIAQTLRRPKGNETGITPALMETHHIFLCINEDYIDLLGPVMRIITAQSIQYLSRRSLQAKSTIVLYLDEFKAVGAIGDFAGAMARLRKRHVRIVLLTQSLSDIESIYGKSDRKSMVTNMKYIILLSIKDVDEQEYFARMIGKHWVKQKTYHGIMGGGKISVSKREEYIIKPFDLATMGDKLILLYPGGHMKLWKNYYFK